jgi:ABC-type branched-subunit amino acid transport system substrate-binding protein
MIFSGDEITQNKVGCFAVLALNRKFTYYIMLLITSLFVIASTSSFAVSTADLSTENNLVNQPIILASSSALSGPAAKLGFRLNQGAEVYFDKINRSGGIAGQKVILKTLDDGYEPFKTIKNTQFFLNDDSVFALFNYVGTPTVAVILPLIEENHLPFLMPFTGAEFLRKPIIKNIFNLRASYYQEVDAQLNYLIKEQKITKIGLLIQADKFGIAVEKGYVSLMENYGLKPVVTTRYRRNTKDVSLALSVLKKKGVEAIAFVGTYEPFAELINTAADQEFTPFFTTVSFISSHDLFPKLKQQSRVLVSEVMPEPQTCTLRICEEFLNDMKQAGKLYTDQVQFEGYLNAYLFTEVAKQCTEKLSQTCFINKIRNFSFDFGGIVVNFSSENNQGLNNIYLNFFDIKSTL